MPVKNHCTLYVAHFLYSIWTLKHNEPNILIRFWRKTDWYSNCLLWNAHFTGRGGSKIRDLQDESGAKIQVRIKPLFNLVGRLHGPLCNLLIYQQKLMKIRYNLVKSPKESIYGGFKNLQAMINCLALYLFNKYLGKYPY